PRVIAAAPDLLVMQELDGRPGEFDVGAERHAADLLAALHSVTSPTAGLEFDTLIGAVHQPNTPSSSWGEFYAQHPLRYMGGEGVRAGRLRSPMLARIERLASNLEPIIGNPGPMSLLHGDVWSGNVLAVAGRITGFIDPAVYFGPAEVELAFIHWLGCFGDA